MTSRIAELRLEEVVPEVFAGDEDRRRSEVWLRRDVVFRRPGRYFLKAESGGGKSSVCAYVYGSRTDYRGRILFRLADGQTIDAATLDPNQWSRLRQRSIAYLPQDMRLFPELTVLENIEIKNRLTAHKSLDEIMEMLRRLDIAGKANEPVGRLSIGQQQRVGVVRALCQPFDFLLLDEPVSHLDARNNQAVARLVEEEAERQEAAIVATSVGNDLLINESTTLLL